MAQARHDALVMVQTGGHHPLMSYDTKRMLYVGSCYATSCTWSDVDSMSMALWDAFEDAHEGQPRLVMREDVPA